MSSVPVPIEVKPILVHFYEGRVPAGFPSPAADHVQLRIDLNDFILINPDATFLIRVGGFSMKDIGIFDGDILVVDRSIEPVSGLIVLAEVNGEFTVKRLYRRGKVVRLLSENEDFLPIEFSEGMQLEIWGVVTRSLRSHFQNTKKKNAKACSQHSVNRLQFVLLFL